MAQTLLQFFSRNRTRVFLIAAIVLIAGGASMFFFRKHPAPSKPQPIPIQTGQPNPQAQTGGGSAAGAGAGEISPVAIRLSQGKPQPQSAAPNPLATGQPLTPAEVDGLLARLPTLVPTPGSQTDFHLAGEPIPPPRTGETVKEPFPPAPQAAPPVTVESGPLKVLRFAPEGEVPVAPFLSVTFNQPMVALSGVEDLKAGQVPVQMDPALPGTWRWLGTQTLTFTYDSAQIDRLPKATEYHVTIPAGTKSAAGTALAEAVTWSFSTPAPKITVTYPTADQPQPRDPLFFIHFDQRIDPAALLEKIHVTAGNQTASLKLASEADVKADERASYLLDGAVAGRWLAFRAAEQLPADSDVTVTVDAGAPSAEGPLTTSAAQTYTFHTYAALAIVDHGCYYGNNQCVPLVPLFIRFNNPIDAKAYDPAMVQIQPELPGASVNIYGDTIQIQGATKGQTTYTVTVSAALQDSFGQKLGQDAALEFKVGSAEPVLYGAGGNFVTVDPQAKKAVFSVYDMNYPRLDVKVYAVQPSDWPAFKQYLQNYQRTDVPQTPIPGRQVLSKTQPVEAAADALTQVDVDLGSLMDGSFGHFIVMVSPPKDLLKDPNTIYWQTALAWVQVTQIGLDAFNDAGQMVVWTTALKDGSPLPGIKVQPGPSGNETVTAENGTARIPIPSGASYLVASQGADQALLPRSNTPWDDSAWQVRPVNDELRWHVFDDRQIYKPGEEVHVKGWLRRIGHQVDGDVSLVGDAVTAVNYQVLDAQGNAIGDGHADVNAIGGFDLALTLPAKVNLGYAQIVMNVQGSLSGLDGSPQQFIHTIQIEEFRRPEFEVTARNETTGPYFAGGSATVAVKASYYAGGALPNADVTWQVTSTPSSYSPPNWPDFSFGEWVPWWSMDMAPAAKPFGPGGGGGDTKVETFTGQTDASGEHYLKLDFGQMGTPQPISVIAQASVMDVNRQAWAGTTTLLVHSADLYVGLRGQQVFVQQGTPLKVDFIVTDLDGKPVTDRPVVMTAARLDWKLVDGNWQEVEVDPQTCKAASAEKPVTCTFQTAVGGSYRITAVVTDEQGRKNQSRLLRWVSGGKLPPNRNVTQEQLTLIPDKESYQPGDVAHILVQSPFSAGEGLLTTDRNGIVNTQRFPLKDKSATLDIQIQASYIPNLNVQVDVNGSAPRTDDQGNPLADTPARPAFATGRLSLSIPPTQRTLALEVTPEQKELEPGGETTLNVALKDANGQPVADAEMAVVVVDEAILALSNYQMADPLKTFYADTPNDLESTYARASLILSDPLTLEHQTSRQGLGGGGAADSAGAVPPMALPAAPAATLAPAMAQEKSANGFGQTAEPIRVRSDFNPLAVFSPSVHTDADGRASVAIKLPDNLTRYRVMVVAVAQGNQFGTGEANLTARLPLMVRPSAPRFLNFGDRFELPVVLQNQTDQPMTVDVAVRAENLELTAASGLRVTVPARDRVEVRFPAAAQLAGTARLQIAATSGSAADAATVELPVYTPATTEAFATYGVIDQGAIAQTVQAPANVFPQYGGLQISTSSTALQSLTDAVLYLVSYPYDCSEQIASRILAIASLRDVLSAFQAPGLPSPEALQGSVAADIQTLQTLQNDDGGFPYWRHGQDSIPFNTIHTAHALYEAGAKGFSVPADMQQRALAYLRSIEDHYPSYYSQHTRWELSAYALNVRNLMGDKDADKALKLIDQAGLDGLSPDAIGWLWPVLEGSPAAGDRLAQIRTYVGNHVVETAGAANFTTTYDDQNYLLLGSDRRTDAILLDALIADNPQHDLIPKLVTGLLANRTQGRWMNTQENVFVLLALDKYFNTFEAQTPDFVARVWLGADYAGSQEFHGRTTDRKETDIPMSFLADATGSGAQNLVLSKEGDGRLYYRFGLSYSPTDLHQAALDMGFVVQRVYEGVDNPADVHQDADGVWHIKAGARVRVHLTMVARDRRYHVALTDPLPAGLEIVNPDLGVSQNPPADPTSPESRRLWWWGPWYEHQNLRDERAEAFTSLLWDGVYQYTYIARATTPGTFVVPPAKAEEMYSPETFGRSASDTVVVE
jgi:alpha-2-macroglobulin